MEAFLNSKQNEAVENFSGPSLILAGAGTGKTRVITHRIAKMLSQGVLPKHVCAMTFTNKAAREMKERISTLTTKKQASRLTVSTFHSFCLFILRLYGQKIELASGFSILGASDQQDIMKRALREKNLHGLYQPQEVLSAISKLKNAGLCPEDEIPHGLLDEETTAKISPIYSLYEQHLRLNNGIDFDDCIFKTVLLLSKNPDVCERLQERFRYILVDEFQDTNMSQFQVIAYLAASHQNVCAVGDDDQSIYSWRGAEFAILQKFKDTFKNCKLIKLEQNYRSTSVILDAANAVIQHNGNRMEKTLWSNTPSEEKIHLQLYKNSEDECQGIAQRCISLLGKGSSPKDIAVLYRTNPQAKGIEFSLRESGVPYKTYGGQSFFERSEVKDFICYLRLILNFDDNLALWRIINTPPRGIGIKSQEAIKEKASSQKTSPIEALKTIYSPDLLLDNKDWSEDDSKDSKGRGANQFIHYLYALKDLPLKTSQDLLHLGTEIIKVFKLENHIRSQYKSPKAREAKLENLRSLPQWVSQSAQRYLEQNEGEEAINHQRLIDFLTLDEAPTRKNEKENEQTVTLMTIHGSKGLEFPIVLLPGLEETLIPHRNSLEGDGNIDEERRLFYVALTRAQKKLHLSYALKRKVGFEAQKRTISRFLQEIPEDLIESSQTIDQEQRAKDNKANTLKRLSELRAKLSLE